MTARDIANQHAFPVPKGTNTDKKGMTYREWLIGHFAAAGLDAESAIVEADKVIERLSKESENL